MLHEGACWRRAAWSTIQAHRAVRRCLPGATEGAERRGLDQCYGRVAHPARLALDARVRDADVSDGAQRRQGRPRCSRASWALVHPARGAAQPRRRGARSARAVRARTPGHGLRAPGARDLRPAHGEDNLRMRHGGTAGARPRFRGELYELFPVLTHMRNRRGGDLSGGQQQQLAIARALIARPAAPAPRRAHGGHPALHHRRGNRPGAAGPPRPQDDHRAGGAVPGLRPRAGRALCSPDKGRLVASGELVEPSSERMARHSWISVRVASRRPARVHGCAFMARSMRKHRGPSSPLPVAGVNMPSPGTAREGARGSRSHSSGGSVAYRDRAQRPRGAPRALGLLSRTRGCLPHLHSASPGGVVAGDRLDPGALRGPGARALSPPAGATRSIVHHRGAAAPTVALESRRTPAGVAAPGPTDCFDAAGARLETRV